MSVALVPAARAQEFNCSVSVNYSQVSGTGFEFLDELEEQLEEYMNGQRFTNDRFLDYERIECNMRIIIQEAPTLTSFRAQLIVETRRPIYGTVQSTNVVRINDQNWVFSYAQGSALNFDVERFDALTSVIDFYAYVMLGYDYDTFSELGGTPHLQRARRIAEIAQGQNAAGWNQAGSDRNRAELITQLLDPRFKPLRAAYFQYHYAGLDHFLLQPNDARIAVLEALRGLQSLYEAQSRQYTLDLFFDTKYQELTALFTESNTSNEAFELLSQTDPAHLTEYNALVN